MTLNKEGKGLEDGGCGEKGVLFPVAKEDTISRLLGNSVRVRLAGSTKLPQRDDLVPICSASS